MRLFDKLLPESVSAAVAVPSMWDTPLGADEERTIERAVDKRKREFRAGRHCAKAALAALGGPADAVVGVGDRRQPLWPAGYTGSISHTRGHCVAVAGRRDDYRGLGIDIEHSQPLGADLMPMICTAREREALAATDRPLWWGKVLFSAKEAIYKAHYPLCEVFFGFQDAEVSLDVDRGSFAAAVRRPRDGLAFDTAGRFGADGDLVGAFIAVPSAQS